MIEEKDHARFVQVLNNLRPSERGCIIMAPNFSGTKSYRSYQMYFYHVNGRWPGSLKKTCTTDGCVVHYKEQGHVLTPEAVEEIRSAPDYWGVTTDLSKKFGVSKARISQIRKK